MDTQHGGNRDHVREDCIEENGDEYNPHEAYYGGSDEYPIKPTATEGESTALVPAGQVPPPSYASHYYAMAVVPGRCTRGFLDVSSFLLCLLAVIVQLGLLDYYYLTNLEDRVWYAWIGADAVVIIVFLWLTILAIRYNQQHMEEVCSVDSKVKYAWLAWLVYSLVLVAKIATCFRSFYDDIPALASDNNDKLFDDHMFKMGLSLSVLVFLFLLEAHHYTALMSARQMYITYLCTAICLDLLDNIQFLDLLWQSLEDKWGLELWLDITILSVACVNFVLPGFALLRLRFGRLPRAFLVSDKLWALFYVLLVNGPLLGLRLYLYYHLEIEQRGRKYDASLFLVKNVAMIYLALRELWTRLQYWRQKRRSVGSLGELTAPNATEE